jgi:hypothetical protein
MRLSRLLAILGAVVGAALSLAAVSVADDAPSKEIGFPREGFSLRVPDGWSIDQYAGPIVRLERGSARLDVTASPSEPDGAPTEAVPVPGAKAAFRGESKGDGTTRARLVAERPDGTWLLAAGNAPTDDAAGLIGLTALFGSLDLKPFPLPGIHADWNHGWSIVVPAGWALAPENGAPRFAAPNGEAVLAVDAWDDLPLARNHRGIQGIDQWVDFGVRSVLSERLDGKAIVEHDDPEVATIGVGEGVDARLAGFKIRTAEQKEKGENGFAFVLVTDRYRLLLLAQKEGSAASNAGYEALKTFEMDTLGASRNVKVPGGPVVAKTPEAGPAEGFETTDAPPVTFRVPKAWTKMPPKSSMRLAQWEVAGEAPGDIAVFWFHAGGGGGVSANLDRWKGQVSGGEATTQEIAVADGIRATVLDAKGSYDAGVMPGASEHVTIADARLLAAVIECPEGPLYVKAYGPRSVMDGVADDFLGWIKSFRAKS